MISREIAIKTSIRIKEGQSVTEVVPLFEQSGLDGLPVYNIHDQMIGILARETVMCSIQNGINEISPLLLNQDYLMISETDDINTVFQKKNAFYLVQNKNDSIVGIISQRQLNEAYICLLQTRLKELETVFEHAPVGITSIDKNGIYTSYNPASEKIVGVKREDAIGRFITDLGPHIPSESLEVLRTGEAQVTKKIGVGKRKYITTRAPIVEGNDITGVVSVFQDISEIERISEELDSVRKLNQQLEAIIQSSYDGIFITDCNGGIIRYNQAIEKLIGAESSKLSNINIFAIFPSFKLDIMKKVLTERKSITISHVLESGVNFIITVNPVLGERNVDYIVVNVRNITELIQLKEEIEKSKLLTERYKEELSQYRIELKTRVHFIGESPKMKQVLHLIKKVSSFNSTTLILGESGSGKEEIARLLHLNSSRSEGPLITINCGAIPENLLESELFGYERGAFTGAGQKGKPGMFELADKGTIFLDEVGDLPFSLQVKLLRAIQEREVTRIGGIKPIPVDVRIIAATNMQLEEKVKNGQFREDLFFRLNVIPITVPPLRERVEDLIPLIEMFLYRFNEFYGLSKKFTPDSYEMLLKYSWPGNVRELRNVIERCFVLSEGDAIKVKEIKYPLFVSENASEQQDITDDLEIRPLKEAVKEFERKLIGRAMEKYGNTYKAAEMLHVDQSTIVRKLQKVKS